MEVKQLELLHNLLHTVKTAENQDILYKKLDEYLTLPEVYGNEAMKLLIEDARGIGDELFNLRLKSLDKTEGLSEKEKAELIEVRRIIAENLFNYHFQPIINVKDGSIYAYEALMRPKSELCNSPFHILKYAELDGKMDDIESATFLNVLRIFDSKRESFGESRIFLNSIPKAKIGMNHLSSIIALMEKHSGSIVVEMTEQSEMDDNELNDIKSAYSEAGVELAIDDYGTGYSNVQNLLRYMPDYVKIDRTLLTDIHINNKKQHFVREIIHFCHDNNIKALAEGVETVDELRTVILLGIDLIQGYYTARPSADIIDSIPGEIKQEIKLFRQEREDGKKLQVYTAENDELILLDRLENENYKCVLVGKNGCNKVTIACTPGLDTNIHMIVADGFEGTVVFENANLMNIKNRPCIDIGENCHVTLVLTGSSQLRYGGIRVPESSTFKCCGDGDLWIYIDSGGYYAIGNDSDAKHGELIFEQGVTIESHAAAGVCIGSGLGGKINMRRGKFIFNMNGNYMGVGIGAMSAPTDINLYACDITLDLNPERCVAIGSLESDSKISVMHSSVHLWLSGSEVVGIGTLTGRKSSVTVCEASVMVNITADRCSAIAALEGDTDFSLSKAGFHITAKGNNALAVGGYGSFTGIKLINADTSINLLTQADYLNVVMKENILIDGGRTIINVNETELINQ